MKRTTLILLLFALGLGGFVYFYEIRGETQRKEVKENQKQLFAFTVDDVKYVSITTENSILNLQNVGEKGEKKWLIRSPISEPANDAIVFYLMDLLVKGKSQQTLSVEPNQISDFGLNEPKATIDIQLKNQQNHQIILGKANFNNKFLYAQIDANQKPKDIENIEVVLVSTDFANAVNRELSEWQILDKKDNEQSESEPLPSLPENIKENKQEN